MLQWPKFSSVKVLSKTDLLPENCYNVLRKEVKENDYAFLLEEGNLSDFLNFIGKSDESVRELNLYNLYVAYNIEFPQNAVSLIGADGITFPRIKSLEKLLLLLMALPHVNGYILVLEGLDIKTSVELRRNILQQFVYLQMFLPILLFEDETQDVKITTVNNMNNINDITILGTKKAGKSSLIDAILGDTYAPFSSELPTPNTVSYYPSKKAEAICLKYEENEYLFSAVGELRKFMEDRFYEANKKSIALSDMQIHLRDFPSELSSFCIIDTPGPNFAGAKGHKKSALSSLNRASQGLFVLNYSSHLTTDEIELFDLAYKRFNANNRVEPLLVAVNRIDEMYSAEVVKSPARVADYIHRRLCDLGYENILVITISAILSVYMKKVKKLIDINDSDICNELRKFKRTNSDKENLTAISFIEKTIGNVEDFYGISVNSLEELARFSGISTLLLLISHTMSGKIIEYNDKTEVLDNENNIKKTSDLSMNCQEDDEKIASEFYIDHNKSHYLKKILKLMMKYSIVRNYQKINFNDDSLDANIKAVNLHDLQGTLNMGELYEENNDMETAKFYYKKAKEVLFKQLRERYGKRQ